MTSCQYLFAACECYFHSSRLTTSLAHMKCVDARFNMHNSLRIALMRNEKRGVKAPRGGGHHLVPYTRDGRMDTFVSSDRTGCPHLCFGRDGRNSISRSTCTRQCTVACTVAISTRCASKEPIGGQTRAYGWSRLLDVVYEGLPYIITGQCASNCCLHEDLTLPLFFCEYHTTHHQMKIKTHTEWWSRSEVRLTTFRCRPVKSYTLTSDRLQLWSETKNFFESSFGKRQS